MGYFPMCVDLTGRLVYLVGSGPQIREKEERLAPFGARLVRLPALTCEALRQAPAFVVAGDLDEREAEETAALCARCGVPVNVVDRPRLCTFFFPSMLVDGAMTVSVSTGGKAPAAAAHLKRRIAQSVPEHAGELIEWLAAVREELGRTHDAGKRTRLMRAIAEAAFEKDAPLSSRELEEIIRR